MKACITFLVSFLLSFSFALFAEPIKITKDGPLTYLYARHDDDRLVRLACAQALTGDAEAAFFLGAVYSDINSLYYKPKTGMMWLIIARKAGYEIADPYIQTSIPKFAPFHLENYEKKAEQCVSSNYVDCLSGDYQFIDKSIGWPPQTKFECKNQAQGE